MLQGGGEGMEVGVGGGGGGGGGVGVGGPKLSFSTISIVLRPACSHMHCLK